MKIKATLHNELNRNDVVVETDGQAKSIMIPSRTSGYGSSVNGAELLATALATCFCNDIYREAARRQIEIEEVSVEVTCEFGGPGEPGWNFRYKPSVVSLEPMRKIEDLLAYTDSVAEIQNTLRKGVDVQLVKS